MSINKRGFDVLHRGVIGNPMLRTKLLWNSKMRRRTYNGSAPYPLIV